MAALKDSRVAWAAAVLVAVVWLNQGPTLAGYSRLVAESRSSSGSVLLRAWLPLAFLYRRSADEELYFAIVNAVRGEPFDADVLLAKRGEAPRGFDRLPRPDGHWHLPYVEVPFEYPALVLPFILLPALVSGGRVACFTAAFGVFMGALVVGAVALALRSVQRRTDAERAADGWLAAGLFLAQGGLMVQRLDAVVALFLVVAFVGAVRRRPFLLGLGIGLATAVKIVPCLLLAPLVAADRDAWRDRDAVLQGAAGLALGAAASLVPMIALSPDAVLEFVHYHAQRGLHVESTYGTILSVVGLLRGRPTVAQLSFGSFNLDGAAARRCAAIAGPLLLVAIAALTAWIAGRPRVGLRASEPDSPEDERTRADRIACAGLGGLLAIWLFAKVLSPQYLTWAIPLALVPSNRRPAIALIAAMAISQVYLRGFYDYVVDGRALGVLTLALRLVTLVVMAVAVARALATATAASCSGRSSRAVR
jgi:hypothetical protein